ncbi:PH domain-containing protein [bacterium 1XD42-1]|nr:PH domain-containing protein [Oscillospiraceae bacterium]RKJ58180.1 PH domain-containing protein [bacterium 1XD42-8]RKJ66988.1 PH domain-containing protein [bacterium 1XD42-1]
MPDMELIWKDRKRILGMPITFTKYSMSKDRLFLETGLLNMNQEEILLYRVRDISLHISLWQRLFGVGTIIVKSSDQTLPELHIENIKSPRIVKEQIHTHVEKMKIARQMRIGEIVDDGDMDHECCHEDGTSFPA